MNPRGFWCTLENLIGRERKRAASKDSYGDVGKWILALPSLRKDTLKLVLKQYSVYAAHLIDFIVSINRNEIKKKKRQRTRVNNRLEI